MIKDVKPGEPFTVDGKRYKFESGKFVEVEEFDSELGGKRVRVQHVKNKPGQEVWIKGVVSAGQDHLEQSRVEVEIVGLSDRTLTTVTCGGQAWMQLPGDFQVEVSPTHLSGCQELTAKELSQIPGIVGRYVALKVVEVDGTTVPLAAAATRTISSDVVSRWFSEGSKLVLLPESFKPPGEAK
jgi:hypothetical protein